ncbi:MAG: polysaccharide biosynthesis protein [Eubacteriales bacterium]|nr:polysaccharide biosynthesis protein [Eubacteriales bacterium]MDY3332911.1 polysaccharide biosynthesis protein [Gallibacter sp.]
MKKHTLIQGAGILALAGIIVKCMGIFLRIPVGNMIGDIGMSNYSPAYIIYSFLLIVSTAGIPIAISRLISEYRALGDYHTAERVFSIAFKLMFALGLFFAVVLFVFAENIAEFLGNTDAAPAMKVIAPALLFVPLLASFRGYFQGMQNMIPTALSEITEQFMRVVVGLTCTYIFFYILKDGSILDSYDKYTRGAVGATIGAPVGAFFALSLMALIYKLARPNIKKKLVNAKSDYSISDKTILKNILAIAIPVMLGAALYNILTIIDTIVVIPRLKAGVGMDETMAKALYGQLSGFIYPILGIPLVLLQAVMISIVPIIAAAYKIKDKISLSDNLNMGLRLSSIITFPCAIGMFVLSKEILLLMYPNQVKSAIEASSILQIASIAIILTMIMQIITSILQAIGKQMIPIKALIVGVVVKFVSAWILIGISFINIHGAIISNILAFGVMIFIGYSSMIKYSKVHVNCFNVFIRPMIAAVVMGLFVYITKFICGKFIPSSTIVTLLAIIIGVFSYIIMVVKTKTITEEEILMMPKGEKIHSIMSKFVK